MNYSSRRWPALIPNAYYESKVSGCEHWWMDINLWYKKGKRARQSEPFVCSSSLRCGYITIIWSNKTYGYRISNVDTNLQALHKGSRWVLSCGALSCPSICTVGIIYLAPAVLRWGGHGQVVQAKATHCLAGRKIQEQGVNLISIMQVRSREGSKVLGRHLFKVAFLLPHLTH